MWRDQFRFRTIAFVHETLYDLFIDPYAPLTAAGLRPGQRVLEVGCGPGFFTLPAADVVGPDGSVVSVDVSPAAVRHVQQKIERADATNVQVFLANAAHTGMPPASFDLIFVFGLGHVIGSLDALWSELHRLLSSDGTLAVEGRLRPPSELFRLVERRARITRFSRAGAVAEPIP